LTQNIKKEISEEKQLPPTSRQPSNAGSFRRVAFTKPDNDTGKQIQEQVNPALRLPAERWPQVKNRKRLNYENKIFDRKEWIN
jgi:hypothetical protein